MQMLLYVQQMKREIETETKAERERERERESPKPKKKIKYAQNCELFGFYWIILMTRQSFLDHLIPWGEGIISKVYLFRHYFYTSFLSDFFLIFIFLHRCMISGILIC